MFKFSSRESQSKKGVGGKTVETVGKIVAGTLAAGTALHIASELEVSKRQDISPEQMQEAMKVRERQEMEKEEVPSAKEMRERVQMPEIPITEIVLPTKFKPVIDGVILQPPITRLYGEDIDDKGRHVKVVKDEIDTTKLDDYAQHKKEYDKIMFEE